MTITASGISSVILQSLEEATAFIPTVSRKLRALYNLGSGQALRQEGIDLARHEPLMGTGGKSLMVEIRTGSSG